MDHAEKYPSIGDGHVLQRLRVACVMGLPVHVLNRKDCLSVLDGFRRHQRRCFLTTPNVNFMVTALQDRDFRDSVCLSDVSVVDGMPLVWVARLLDIPVHERVSGADLFEDLSRSDDVWRTFFVGGPEGAAKEACLRLSEAQTKMVPVGFFYPGFSSLDDMPNAEIIQSVHAARPDLLILALGAVKGQAWIRRHLEALPACVVSHLGAVVNFAAGGVLRAPVWVQRSGLEWIWRIKEEPALWRRYWKDGCSFLGFFVRRTVPLAFGLWIERLQLSTKLVREEERCFRMFIRRDGLFVLSGFCWDGKFDDLMDKVDDRLAQHLDVVMDLSVVKSVDPFFAGFLMVTEARLRLLGRRLVLIGVPRCVSRRFHWMGAGALMEAN